MPQQVLQEVDNNFIGVNSRLDPSNLQPGFAQSAYNVRMQRGTAQPRKGCARLTDATILADTMVGSGTYVDANGQDNIVLVFTDGIRLYNTETQVLGAKYAFPSEVVSSVQYYRNIEDGSVVDVVQALDKLYIFRGQENEARYGAGGDIATAALDIRHDAVAAGASVTVTATWLLPVHPTYVAGQEVTIFNVTNLTFGYLNQSYIVTSSNSTVFTFTYTNNTGANIPALTHAYSCVVKVKPPLIWDGTSVSFASQTSIFNNIQTTSTGADMTKDGSLPPSDFGFYFQNRIVCKITNDRLAVSDILSEVFDFTLNNFVINQGGNDSIVGVLPWIENQFVVFMKKSIYIAFVEPTTYDPTAPPGENSSITVVTTQIGCLSRKSIVAAGQFVFFLSGKGVHVLTPQLDLKLIGQTVPLSEPIDDFFDSVNFAAADKTVASYYDNRFFIALPINDSVRPNAILVYNTLNQQWECIDTYPTGLYIDDYAICQYGNKRRQFILTRFSGVNTYGGIFLTEEYPNVDVSSTGDEFSSIGGTPTLPFFLPAILNGTGVRQVAINARIRSRQYTFDNTNQKRFSRGEYQFNNIEGDNISIVARTHDPDVYEVVMNYVFTGSATTDSTLRPRIALRGACMDMEVIFNSGRPALKSAALYAIVANRNMVSEE